MNPFAGGRTCCRTSPGSRAGCRAAADGTDAEQAGARRAWYCAHLPLPADRSPAYAPSGSRDPALDHSHDVVDEWLQYTASPDRNGS